MMLHILSVASEEDRLSYWGDCCCDCPVNDLDEEAISDHGCPVKILEELTKE